MIPAHSTQLLCLSPDWDARPDACSASSGPQAKRGGRRAVDSDARAQRHGVGARPASAVAACKCEGDGRAPAGFCITALFGYAAAARWTAGLPPALLRGTAGSNASTIRPRPITTASSTKRGGERLGILRGHAAPGPALRSAPSSPTTPRRRAGRGLVHLPARVGTPDTPTAGCTAMAWPTCRPWPWLDGARRRCWCSCPSRVRPPPGLGPAPAVTGRRRR
jgi:hypothetical protein